VALVLPALARGSIRWQARLRVLLALERGRYALWLPVFMIGGVLAYFNLRAEPAWWEGLGCAGLAAAGVGLARERVLLRAGFLCLLASSLGFLSAELAAIRAPPLAVLPTHAEVFTGTVGLVETLPEGRRITLDHVQIADGSPIERRLRIRLRKNDAIELTTGDRIRVRALVRPPSPPAYPGGWDLQRDAFFSRIGGYGFALGPIEQMAGAKAGGASRSIEWLRETIDTRIARATPGAAGAIAATLLTGAASAIPEADRAAFRDSGLAHLLAVAGLHIGIVMGLLMGAVRAGLALSERAALYWPIRQIAAVAALAAGGFYLLLTGAHVPIIRSFAMACLFTLAVLAGRRAVSLRGLALAAATLVLMEPAQVVGVSFQMSFSAVLALIAGYETLRPQLHALYGDGSWGRRFVLHLAALALTSFLAGTASAPFGAYHFGRVQLYFILANMVAVPLTAMWIMPAGLIALALMPLRLEVLALKPMCWGIDVVLWIARATSALPSATLPVPHMPAAGLAILALGMAWLGLWRSRVRLAGVPLIVAGLLSPAAVHPADILVSADASLIAVRTKAGVFIEVGRRADRFDQAAWLQYWGGATQNALPNTGEAANGAVACTASACTLTPRPGAAPALLLRTGTANESACSAAAVILSAEPARGRCHDTGGALVDRFTVWREGAIAIWLDGPAATIVTDRAERGARPWVPPSPEARPRRANKPLAATE
jgi:competence protein ComEC